MVTVNRDLEASQASVGWDPYEVWFVRIRGATLQLAHRRYPFDTWARPKTLLVRVLQTTSLLCV